jgi:hypothetical protein
MQTITNSSKHLSEEVILVKEDRVVLELHSKNAVAEKEQIIEKLQQEIQNLKS